MMDKKRDRGGGGGREKKARETLWQCNAALRPPKSADGLMSRRKREENFDPGKNLFMT